MSSPKRTFRVLGLWKVPDTDPPEYELRWIDLASTKPSYSHSTENGTEPELRAMLKDGGMPEPDIIRLFKQAA